MPVKFVDELPSPLRGGGRAMWDELARNPGQWAEWWTDNPRSAYSAAVTASRNDVRAVLR